MKSLKSLSLVMLLISLVIAGCSSNSTSSSQSSSSPTPASSEGKKGSDSPAASAVTIRLAHSSAPGSARDLGAKKFKEVIEKETNGKVKVEIYPASQLGSPTEQVQAVQLGSLEMDIVPTSFMGGFQPLITLLDIPFLFPKDKDALLKLQQGDAMRALLNKTDDVGIHTLGIWHTGYKEFTGPKPLNTPEAFKGLKFRAMPSPVIFEQFKVLGASPTDIPFAETYNALQTGTIDAQENPLDTTFDMKFHEVQKFATMTNHGVLDQMLIINKKFYDGLDQDIKDAMYKSFEAGRVVTVEKTYENIDKARKVMQDSGMKFVEVTPEERQTFVDKMKPVRDFYVKKFGDEGKQLLDAISAEIEK